MTRRILLICLTFMSMIIFTFSPAAAAPGAPLPGPTLRHCSYAGQFYPHGSLIKIYTRIGYDVYKCSDGAWVYISSSDDIN
jgi:hypothetical protein